MKRREEKWLWSSTGHANCTAGFLAFFKKFCITNGYLFAHYTHSTVQLESRPVTFSDVTPITISHTPHLSYYPHFQYSISFLFCFLVSKCVSVSSFSVFSHQFRFNFIQTAFTTPVLNDYFPSISPKLMKRNSRSLPRALKLPIRAKLLWESMLLPFTTSLNPSSLKHLFRLSFPSGNHCRPRHH